MDPHVVLQLLDVKRMLLLLLLQHQLVGLLLLLLLLLVAGLWGAGCGVVHGAAKGDVVDPGAGGSGEPTLVHGGVVMGLWWGLVSGLWWRWGLGDGPDDRRRGLDGGMWWLQLSLAWGGLLRGGTLMLLGLMLGGPAHHH